MKKLFLTLITLISIQFGFAQEKIQQAKTQQAKVEQTKAQQAKIPEITESKETKKSSNTNFILMPIHNSVAGFSNVFLGSIGLSKNVNFTFYSVFWNNPSFGNFNSGSDLFLETGIGLGFKLGNLYVNPTLGFGHGKFLSGGTETVIGDGFIPSLGVLYNTRHFELDAYIALYKAFRKRGNTSRDLLLNWVAPGYKVNKRVSLGAYYEQFAQVRNSDESPEKSIYQWMGGYVKLSLDNGVWFRFAAGPNLATDLGTGEEFYKIQAFIPLK